ncbi:MAG: serine hydrolase domain-containing protein [Candidatus Dormibacteraceae bacterium]
MSIESNAVPIADELDAQLGAYVEAGQAPGLAYGIVSADGLQHAAAFGRADDAGTAPDADTRFPIASMSKSFTAAAVLIARDRGLLSLDDPITRFIPDFRATGAPESPCDPPTLRMLLSMSAGLTEDNAWVDPQIGMTEEELLRLVARGLKYTRTPGTAYEYSNVGFTLAGLALQRATGAPIAEFITRELLEPLGMRSTSFSPVSHPASVRAPGYSLDPEGAWRAYPVAESGAFAAAGGIVSTVRDLTVWVTWLGEAFRPGRSLGIELLSRTSRRELQRIEIIIPPAVALRPSGSWHLAVAGYALGLVVEHDLYRGTIVSHSGGLPGYLLHMRWHPDSGEGLVVLTNSHRGDPVSLAAEAFSRLLQAHRVPSETIHLWKETVEARRAVETLIRRWDEVAADRLFAENVDFDRPLAERRAEIDELVRQIGPLLEPRPLSEIVSAATAADVTWSIPGERGELICMIHLTEIDPPRVQELAVTAVPSHTPRSAAPWDISPRRAALGDASLSAAPNVRVVLP